jgi:hypothetical protein
MVNLCGCIRLCGRDRAHVFFRQLPYCSNHHHPAAVVVVHSELSEAVAQEIERPWEGRSTRELKPLKADY